MICKNIARFFSSSSTRVLVRNYTVLPCDSHSILEVREKLAKTKCNFASARDISQRTFLVPQEDRSIAIELYRGKELNKSKKIPTCIIYPATSFVAGEPREITNAICGIIAKKIHGQVICVHAGLAPEIQYPVSFKGAYQALKSIVAEPNDFSVDADNCLVAGFSSGGNFAALAAIQAAKEGISLKGQILISPLLDLSRELNAKGAEKYEHYKELQNKKQCVDNAYADWSIAMYVPSYLDLKNPAISPYWVSEERLTRLKTKIAPMVLFIPEYDVVRADAHMYHDKFLECGINSRLYVAKEADHSCFWQNSKFVHVVADTMSRLVSDPSKVFSSREQTMIDVSDSQKNREPGIIEISMQTEVNFKNNM